MACRRQTAICVCREPQGGPWVASSVLSLSTTETFGSVCVCGLPTARGSECHSLLVLQVLPFVRPGHNPELPNWESVLFCWHLSQEPRHVLASQEERGLCVEGLREGKDLVPDQGRFSSLHLVALSSLLKPGCLQLLLGVRVTRMAQRPLL